MAWLGLAGMGGYMAAVMAGRRMLARRWRGTRFVTLDVRGWSSAEWMAGVLALTAGLALAGGVLAAAVGRPGPHLSAGSRRRARGSGGGAVPPLLAPATR